jgi:hypothetical protein
MKVFIIGASRTQKNNNTDSSNQGMTSILSNVLYGVVLVCIDPCCRSLNGI